MSSRECQASRDAMAGEIAICIDEIRRGLKIGDKGVDSLMSNFMKVAHLIDELVDAVDATTLPESDVPRSVNANKIRAVMNDSVRAFQFYDRLTQQINHAVGLLEEVVSRQDEDRADPVRWEKATHQSNHSKMSVELFK